LPPQRRSPVSSTHGLFGVQIPEGEEHVEGTLALEQARQLADFDLFWFGETAGAL